jgi:hypothetical protein
MSMRRTATPASASASLTTDCIDGTIWKVQNRTGSKDYFNTPPGLFQSIRRTGNKLRHDP